MKTAVSQVKREAESPGQSGFGPSDAMSDDAEAELEDHQGPPGSHLSDVASSHKLRFDLNADLYNRWRTIGYAESLKDDAEISSFLVELYENTLGSGLHPGARCVHCQAPVTPSCARCQLRTPLSLLPGSVADFRVHSLSTGGKAAISTVTTELHQQTGMARTQAEGEVLKTENMDRHGVSTVVESEHSLATGKFAQAQLNVDDISAESSTHPDKPGMSEENISIPQYGLPVFFKREPDDGETEPLTSQEKDVPRARAHSPVTPDTIEDTAGDTQNSHPHSSDSRDVTVFPWVEQTISCIVGLMAENESSSESSTDNNQIPCTECTASFHTASELESHRRLHHIKKVSTCEICGSTFAHSSSLKRHMRIHTGERPFVCKICNAAFTQSSTLKQHIQTHTGEKRYTCKVCQTVFTMYNKLKEHMKTHTGDNPYVCVVCSASFPNFNMLRRHLLSHEGEKPYTCEECGASFAQSGYLKDHMRTHTGDKPYVCKVCGTAFTQSGVLNQHMRIHRGEKPYVCSVCNAAFTQAGVLTRHMRTHTGDKPYTCEHCGAKFSRSDNLKEHMGKRVGDRVCVKSEARILS